MFISERAHLLDCNASRTICCSDTLSHITLFCGLVNCTLAINIHLLVRTLYSLTPPRESRITMRCAFTLRRKVEAQLRNEWVKPGTFAVCISVSKPGFFVLAIKTAMRESPVRMSLIREVGGTNITSDRRRFKWVGRIFNTPFKSTRSK
jgi:hypothetical protein